MKDPSNGFSANEAEALFDGAAYDEMLGLIRRARDSVAMAFFLFGGPDADRMMDALAVKQAQGVDVRVLLDRSLGREGLLPDVSWECRGAFRRMRALGLDVRRSDPRPPPGWPGKPALLHRKLLVRDGEEALVGGMNVGRLFRRYHDLMLRLRGPVAVSMQAQFDADWDAAGGGVWPVSTSGGSAAFAGPVEDSGGLTWARLTGTGGVVPATETALRQNLSRARRSVDVALCEMGRTGLLDELIACHRRGLAVRVLLDPLVLLPGLGRGPHNEAALNAGAVAALQGAAVPVHFYRLGRDFIRLHLKMALFDGRSAVAGSTNWTRSGFGWISETDAELHGGVAVGQLAAQFERDWARSAPAPPPSRLSLWQYRLYERWAQ